MNQKLIRSAWAEVNDLGEGEFYQYVLLVRHDDTDNWGLEEAFTSRKDALRGFAEAVKERHDDAVDDWKYQCELIKNPSLGRPGVERIKFSVSASSDLEKQIKQLRELHASVKGREKPPENPVLPEFVEPKFPKYRLVKRVTVIEDSTIKEEN
jgi:hypothetical protein